MQYLSGVSFQLVSDADGISCSSFFCKKPVVFESKGTEWVAQRPGGCPMPRNSLGQAGQDSEQTHLVEDAPAHYGDVGLDEP